MNTTPGPKVECTPDKNHILQLALAHGHSRLITAAVPLVAEAPATSVGTTLRAILLPRRILLPVGLCLRRDDLGCLRGGESWPTVPLAELVDRYVYNLNEYASRAYMSHRRDMT